METRENTIRGEVVIKWERKGNPYWDTDRTITACIEVDRKLEKRNLRPAPKFPLPYVCH